MSASNNAGNLPRWSLKRMLSRIPIDNPNTSPLPYEIWQQIIDDATGDHRALNLMSWTPPLPVLGTSASVPPRNGASPFMNLPTELRRAIFAETLPACHFAHHPKCDDDEAASQKEKKKKGKGPPRNATFDLMILSKKICGEITEVMYEERFFVIHVHEGLRKGGIEFLQAGRQPLQYQDCIYDTRIQEVLQG